jgi:diketogulonate reductase-like aldo/keto reductase
MQGYQSSIKAIESSLTELKTSYIDLMLVHWPGVQGLSPSDPKQVDLRHETWQALEEMQASGKIKAIGVSNFTIKHLEKLLKIAKVKPTVNQFELHPWCQDPDLETFCNNEKILIEAYSPLARGLQDLWKDESLTEIAEELKVTKAQVLLRWNLQKGNIILPKSSNQDRLEENSKLDFELSELNMKKLSDIRLKTSKRTCWDPNTILV